MELPQPKTSTLLSSIKVCNGSNRLPLHIADEVRASEEVRRVVANANPVAVAAIDLVRAIENDDLQGTYVVL